MTPGEKGRLDQMQVTSRLHLMNEKGPKLGRLEGTGDDEMPPLGRTELPEDLATSELRPSDLALAASNAEEVVGSSDTEEESVVEVTPMPRRTAPTATEPRPSIPPPPLDRLKQQFAAPSASPTVFTSKQEVDVAPSSETEEASDCASSSSCSALRRLWSCSFVTPTSTGPKATTVKVGKGGGCSIFRD